MTEQPDPAEKSAFHPAISAEPASIPEEYSEYPQEVKAMERELLEWLPRRIGSNVPPTADIMLEFMRIRQPNWLIAEALDTIRLAQQEVSYYVSGLPGVKTEEEAMEARLYGQMATELAAAEADLSGRDA